MEKKVEIPSRYPVLEIASYLKYLGATTNLIINKLLYFTQAYFLVLNEGKEALFYEDIVVFPYGPVVIEIFNAFNKGRIIPSNSSLISTTDKILIKEVYDYFKNDGDMVLVNITKQYDIYMCLWEKETSKNIPFTNNEILSKEMIYNYHIKQGF